eukprot:scaffold5823_cov295-Prasinococcus_capsulatus_cf.AAC.4
MSSSGPSRCCVRCSTPAPTPICRWVGVRLRRLVGAPRAAEPPPPAGVRCSRGCRTSRAPAR